MTMTELKILGINHLGMAAKDPAKARWFFQEVLGLPHLGDETVASQSVDTVMLRARHQDGPDQTRLELLAPSTPGAGPIGKYLEKFGGGIHHVALSVASVDGAIAAMNQAGVQMIDDEPRPGAHQTRIAFVHPKATGGFLVEFVEETT